MRPIIQSIPPLFTLNIFVQPVMFDYIVATANLHAFNYGLKGKSDPEFFKKVLAEIEVPEFQPKEGVKIQVNENEPVANESSACRSWPFRQCSV